MYYIVEILLRLYNAFRKSPHHSHRGGEMKATGRGSGLGFGLAAASGGGMTSSSGSANAGGGGKKKMIIKPFKVQPKLPDDFEDSTWTKLRAAVVAIQNKEPVSTSREELYRAVEDLCAHKMAARLYDRLQEVCDAHIKSQLAELVGQTRDHAAFLERADEVWRTFGENQLTIRNVFLYLDRSYVLQTPSVLSIWDMGLSCFRRHLLDAAEVESKVTLGLLALIERERAGEDVGRDLLRSLLRMLSHLDLYREKFEERFLRETELFYAAEGVRYMSQSDVSLYLAHVDERLSEEAERAQQYLDSSTRKSLISVVEAQLLAQHTPALLERGFSTLMDAQRLSDLRRMYSLFARVGHLDQLKVFFTNYVRVCGSTIVMDKENDKEMISTLLAYKARLDEVLTVSFRCNEQYLWAHKAAWETFINERQNRPAELLAKFVDVKLRGEKGMSEDEVESLLDRLMVLFKYLAGKDTFEAFYKKDLAKRLLLSKSASFDLETSMIAKLKAECGSAFTNKLEGMFKDMELTRELMKNYSTFLEDKMKVEPEYFTPQSRHMEVNMQVLTTGYWPAYPVVDTRLPAAMVEHQGRFAEYYGNKYQGRRLAWQSRLGQCVLKASFPKGRKELAVSQLQATVLLLCFNSKDEMSFVDIKDCTAMEDGELRLTLQSLACGKIRVLHKEPRSREVGDTDTFLFNADFTNKLFRIKINTIQLKETAEENEKTHESVFSDRQYQVDAAIVRIMKARKTLSHQMLISELLGQLKFPAKAADLKKRIECLIEREYLERNDSGGYNYVA
jgi:cullin-4